MPAAQGIVNTHAQIMRVVIPHRTAENLFAAPTPTIAPVIVCVVETGIPAKVAPNKLMAAAVSAQNPPYGWSLVIFDPMVRTMRHPPESVPKPIAACAERTTHN